MASFSIKQGQPSLLQGLAIGGAQGIASGLQSLAADRLANIRAQNEQRQLAQTLKSLNLNQQEQGDILHLLPPDQRLSALRALASIQPQQQEPQPSYRQAPAPEPTQFEAAQQTQREQLGLTPQGPPLPMQQ